MNLLAIDQGTSSTKALVVGEEGEILARASRPVHPRSIGADGVEQDPMELLDTVIAAGQQALQDAGVEVQAVGLANQGETVLAFDPVTGAPHTPAIGWQDRRSGEVTARLADRRERLIEVCGLPLDPYFAAPKMAWVREHLTRDGVVATTDAWLLHRLGVGYLTDTATASRTMLLDLDRVEWSPANAEAFGLDAAELPKLVGCAEPVGQTSAFGPRLPVTGLAVDQQAALFGQGCLRAGQGKCTYGTGAFLLATTGELARRSGAGLSASVAWTLAGTTTYCLDGQVYTVGAAIDWLHQLGLIGDADDLDRLGGSVPDSGGVVFVPSLAGLGAPYWQPDAKGACTGLTLGTTAAHLVRSVVDGVAAQVAVLVAAMAEDLGRPLESLRVDGGLTRSRLLLQTQADLVQVPVHVPPTADLTALGVAALARLGAGGAASAAEAIGEVRQGAVYEPRISSDEAGERVSRWQRVLEATLP